MIFKRHLLTAIFVLIAGGGAGNRGGQRGGMGRGRGRGRGGRDMSLISQTVRISQGPYKGKLSIGSCLIELAESYLSRSNVHENIERR